MERFPLFTPEARYNVTITWTTLQNEDKIPLASITVLGRFEGSNEIKRRRQAIGKKGKRPKTQPNG